jgi:hypothetical protein
MEPQGRREPVKGDREIVLEKWPNAVVIPYAWERQIQRRRKDGTTAYLSRWQGNEDLAWSDAATRIRKEGNQ